MPRLQPSWGGSCSSSARRRRSAPPLPPHRALPASSIPFRCLPMPIPQTMNAAAHAPCARETQAAGTLETVCTGHAGTHASRLSLRRQAGTSMYGPCICTASEDMRMGRDARMSHAAGRVRSGIRRIFHSHCSSGSLGSSCSATALPLDRGSGHMSFWQRALRKRLQGALSLPHRSASRLCASPMRGTRHTESFRQTRYKVFWPVCPFFPPACARLSLAAVQIA